MIFMPLFSRKKDNSVGSTPSDRIFPVTAFRLMIAALQSQYSREPSHINQAVWQGRTLHAIKTLLPYVEFVFSGSRPAPGIDIKDSSHQNRYEIPTTLSQLERILELSSVKAWLCFHESEPGWEDLYNMVLDIPGFESLSVTNKSELSDYEFVIMPAKRILLDLATNHRALVQDAK